MTVDQEVKRILITSPLPQDGKTTTSVNLGSAFAEAGARVVIVGCDLRRPGLGTWVSVNESVGLTNLLLDEAEILQVAQPSGMPGLDVIPSGPLPPNPAELLGSDRAKRVFEQLAEMYDVVIADSAPILPVADAAVMARWMDGVVLVVRADQTKASDVVDAMSELGRANARVLGFVLNGSDDARREYYYDRSQASVGEESRN